MGITKIHSQELLQIPSQRNTTSKTLHMDMEVQMLQQVKNFFMATPNGQVKHQKLAEKEKIRAGRQ